MDAARRNCFQPSSCPWTWTKASRTLRTQRLRESAPASRCHRIVGRANGDRPPHATVPESEKERRPGHFLTDLLGGDITPALHVGGQAPNPADPSSGRLVSGGYPEPLGRGPVRARQWHREYVRSIVDRYVLDVVRVRDADGVARLLQLLAARNGELLNTAGLSRDLGLRRSTVREYIAVLERLFLVRSLRPWHRRVGKRLMKTHEDAPGRQWARRYPGRPEAPGTGSRSGDRMGHFPKSFVVHQFVSEAGWTDPDLRFRHFRDKDRQEVDLVMTLGARTWGIEVKATSTPGRSAGRGMMRLAALCGDDFEGGWFCTTGGMFCRWRMRGCWRWGWERFGGGEGGLQDLITYVPHDPKAHAPTNLRARQDKAPMPRP